jgi:hypothetical protein
MHEVRAASSRRNWLVLGAVLLLTLLALSLLLKQRRNAAAGANAAAPDAAASSLLSDLSAAEKARRAAIAALGPIKRREGTNAAEFYKQAIGLYNQLTDDEKNMLRHPRDKQDPKVAAALYAKIQPIMDLLRKARKADYADWGLGPMTLENSTNKTAQYTSAQQLAVLAIWDSTYRFQSDPDGAVGDLAAMEALGRSEDDSLIGLMVENSIHSGAMWLLAQNAGGITSAAGPDLAEIVNPAAVQQSFQIGLDAEASMLQSALDEYANPATRNGSLIQKWTSLGALSGEQAVSDLEWLEQTEQALGTDLQESNAQFQQWWAQKQAQAASMPLVGTALSNLANVRAQSQMSVAWNAMLAAGMALEQNNQAQFQSIPDPSTGQPFTVTQTATGFQLGSAMQYHGKPVTLSFSMPAAK